MPDTAVAVQVHQVAERHGIGVTASLKDAELDRLPVDALGYRMPSKIEVVVSNC